MNKIEDQIFERYKEIANRLHLIQKEVVSSLKINLNYFKVLAILFIKGKLTQTELSDICLIDKPATSRLICKMHFEKLIQKAHENGNKKNIYLSLTEKGKAISEKIKGKFIEYKSKYFTDLIQPDKTTFLCLLDKHLAKGEKNA